MKQFLLITIFYFSFLTVCCFAQQTGWDIIPTGITAELQSVHFSFDSNGYAVGNTGTVLKSNDGGLSWQNISVPALGNLNDVFVFDQYTVETVGDAGKIFKTTDCGINWMIVQSGVTDNLYSVSFVDSFGICGGGSQTILYSSDSGTSWNISQTGFFGGGFYGASMLSQEIGFVAGENSIFQTLFGKTTDSGMNWIFKSFYLNNNEGKAYGIDFTDENIGYICSGLFDLQGAISKTTNSGTDWNTTLFGNALFGIDFPISNTGLTGYSVGQDGLILKTYDAGLNWQTQQSGTILTLNKVFFLDPDFGFAVGQNGLIIRTTSGGEPVTNINDENFLGQSFRLEQNYPNPFNPTTIISWQTPISGQQTLKVFNVLGKEVATLVDEYKPAGKYEVEFNASSLPSGIYFYQLNTEDFVQTKKMIFLK